MLLERMILDAVRENDFRCCYKEMILDAVRENDFRCC